MTKSEYMNECEVFQDPSYYDMWAVRADGETDFGRTLHFQSRKHAVHATEVIGELIAALKVFGYAYNAKTTQDGLKMIGLGKGSTFPAMQHEIKSTDQAQEVLDSLNHTRRNTK